MYKKFAPFIVILLILAACSSESPVAVTPDPGEIATQVAQTVQAELTRIALAAPTTAVPPSPTLEAQITATALPSPTSTPTLEPTVTLVPTATSIPLSTDPKQSLGPPDWQDTFKSAASWYLYEDEHTKFELEDENLLLTAKNADGWSGWALSWPILQDFYLEATMTAGECEGLDRYGLVFRAKNPNEGYLFGITCDSNYSLRKWDGERFTLVQIWTPSKAINVGPEQANRVGVMAQGKELAMYVNGQFLGVVVDESYAEGAIGLFVGSVNTPNFQVSAQEISYWELPVSE
jgi:hypothetical protein